MGNPLKEIATQFRRVKAKGPFQDMLNVVAEVMEKRAKTGLMQTGIGEVVAGTYPWNEVGGDLFNLESVRQKGQNKIPLYIETHNSQMREIIESNSDITHILHLGVGVDATLLIADAMYGLPVYGVEVHPAKVAAARERIHKLQLDSQITMIEGDAGKIKINTIPGRRVIDATLILGHLPDETIAQILGNVLRDRDLLHAVDLRYRDWQAASNVSSKIEKVKLINEVLIPTMIKVGWTQRGANAWDSENKLEDKLVQLSNGKVKIVESRTYRQDTNFNGLKENPLACVVATIAPTLAMAAETTRDMEKIKKAWGLAIAYEPTLMDPELIHTYPGLMHQIGVVV